MAQSYSVGCPDCGYRMRVEEEHFGHTGKCGKCGAAVPVTADTTEPLGVTPRAESRPSEIKTGANGREWRKGDILLDQYEVKGVLGEGGMGKVHRVHHRGWNMDLAVKSPRAGLLSNRDAIGNFEREAETWVNLGLHPNTVSCYYVREVDGIPRLFAECVEGGSLGQWIRNGKLYEGGPDKALERILDVAIQFAWGLHFAHRKGLVHQDVKPYNVMMTLDGSPKVTDFGLAKARAEASDAVEHAGSLTVEYASPEQAGGTPLSPKTDIWSWGLTVLEMFAGELTWRAGIAAPEILADFLSSDRHNGSIPSMPGAIAELLRRCFQHEADARPDDMNEIASGLSETYCVVVGNVYSRPQPEEAKSLADSLSNRGVSLLDLGKPEEAQRAFEAALAEEATHPEALFNRGLLQWRSAQITDSELVRQLTEAKNSRPADWRTAYVLGLVHIERGDADAAMRELEQAQQWASEGQEAAVREALDTARQGQHIWGRCVRVLKGHRLPVTSVCFSPDGRSALSADGTVQHWDLASGKGREIPDASGTLACFSPDQLSVVTGSRSLHRIDIATGKSVTGMFDPRTLGRSPTIGGYTSRFSLGTFATSPNLVRLENLETSSLKAVSFSPDGKLVLSARQAAELWDAETGKCVKVLADDSQRARCVCFSPDGRFALVGGRTVAYCSVEERRRLGHHRENMDDVLAVSFSRDGCQSASVGGNFLLRDLDTGQILRDWPFRTDTVECASISPDCDTVVTGAKEGLLRLWSTAGRCLRTLAGHDGAVNSTCISPDGRFALSGGKDTMVRLWDLSPGEEVAFVVVQPRSAAATHEQASEFDNLLQNARKELDADAPARAADLVTEARSLPGLHQSPVALGLWNEIGTHGIRRSLGASWAARELTGHAGGIRAIAVTRDGHFALSGSKDETIRLWEIATGECVRAMEGTLGEVVCVSLSADGRLALSAGGGLGSERTIRLWNVETGQCQRIFKSHGKGATSLCFAPREGAFVWCGRDTGTHIQELHRSHGRDFGDASSRPVAAEISRDGLFVISAGALEDNRPGLHVWEPATGTCSRTIEGHEGWIRCIRFSPDSRLVASGSLDRTVRLWEVTTGRCVATFKGHAGSVLSVDVSPDSRFVLSGSADGTFRVWNVSSGACEAEIQAHSGQVNATAFTPDGRHVVSGGDDGIIRVWELDWEYAFPESHSGNK